MSLRMDHVGPKTRSVGEILGENCAGSSCQIFMSDTHETWSDSLPQLDI